MSQKFDYVSLRENDKSIIEFENCTENVDIRLKDTDGDYDLIKLFPVTDKLIMDSYPGMTLEVRSVHSDLDSHVLEGAVIIRVRKNKGGGK